MLRPTAIKVLPLEDYLLQIHFDNGEIKIFDVKPYINGKWYGKLSEYPYFSQVKTDGYSISWPDGQDLCPDEIYHNSKPIT